MMLSSIESLLFFNYDHFSNPIICENPWDFISSLTFFLFYEFKFLDSCYEFSSLTFYLRSYMYLL